MIKIKKLALSIYNFINNTFYFKLFYLFLSIAITTLLFAIPGVVFLNKLLIIWGALLVIINLIKLIQSKRLLYPFEIIIYIFLTISLIILLFNFLEPNNIIIWLINTILLTVVFSIDSSKYKSKLKKELNFISLSIALFTFVLSSISIVMIMNKYSFSTSNSDIVFHNMFINNYFLGASTIISFIISLYLLFNSKILLGRVFNITNCLCQIVALFLAHSTSAFLVLIGFLFIYLFIYIKNISTRIVMLCIPNLYLIYLFVQYPNSFENLLSTRNNIWINGFIGFIFILTFIFSIFIFLVRKLDSFYSDEKVRYTCLLGLLIGLVLIGVVQSNLIFTINFIGSVFWIYSGYLVSLFHKNRAS